MEKLTAQEEETMQVIWTVKQGFIKDFLNEMPEPKPPYTTLASTIKNLERKGFLQAEKLANSFRYSPAIKAEDYKKTFMKFFAKEEKISAEELKDIINLIEKKSKK
jgi:BlaI family penicillinase repressor